MPEIKDLTTPSEVNKSTKLAGSLADGTGVGPTIEQVIGEVFKSSSSGSPNIGASNTITCWGDSLTAGTGATSGLTFPYQLGLLTGLSVDNQGVGGENSTQIKNRMLAATAKHNNFTVIWAGRNNFTAPATVKADIAAMVAALAAAGNTDRYVVLSILNGNYSPSTTVTGDPLNGPTAGAEWSGQANYLTLATLNSDLATTYGARFIDVRAFLVSRSFAGVAQDALDRSRDVPPSTLRSDQIHLNNAGYSAVADIVFAAIVRLFRQYRVPVTAASISAFLARPGRFGVEEPNLGVFSDLFSPLIRVGSPASSKFFSLSGDASAIQANAHLIPLSHGVHNIGFNTALAFLNGYFTGHVHCLNVNADNIVKYGNYKAGPHASGATVDILRVGAASKRLQGLLRVSNFGVGGVSHYNYILSITGGATGYTVTPVSTESESTAQTITLTTVKDTPTVGTNTVRVTIGGLTSNGIEYGFTPLSTDAGTTIVNL